MKDHETRQLHDDLRDTAIRYASSQQLRARLATVVDQFLKKERTWIITPIHAHFDPKEVVGHRLTIPSVTDDLIIKSLRVEDNILMHEHLSGLESQLQRPIKRTLEVIGEIKVPKEVELWLVK